MEGSFRQTHIDVGLLTLASSRYSSLFVHYSACTMDMTDGSASGWTLDEQPPARLGHYRSTRMIFFGLSGNDVICNHAVLFSILQRQGLVPIHTLHSELDSG